MTDEAKPEAMLKIDGREYPFPAFDTLTMDEADILYSYSKVTLDKMGELEGAFHPGVIMGFVHIAIARTRPDLKAKEIEERVRTLKVLEMQEIFGGMAEGDDVNPPSATDAAPVPSGESSAPASAPSPVNGNPEPFGSLRSAIGAA